MTLTVDDDFAAFVAARWPDLEALALVTTLDPALARESTAHALGRLRAEWPAAVEDGAPTSRARRAVLERSIHVSAASSRPAGSAPAPPGATRRARDGVGAGEEGDVEASLWQCLLDASPQERAVLACQLVSDLDLGESAHLLGMPGELLRQHDHEVRGRLASAHAAGRAAGGQPPAEWLLEDDLRSVVEDLVDDAPDPPDPAGLVAAEAAGVRRRTLVVAGGAVLAVAATGWAVSRRAGSDGPVRAGPATLGPTAGDWSSTTTWPPRGGLGADVGVQGMILSRTSSGSRLIFADDVGDRRVVLAAPIGLPNGPVGTEVRAWVGARGALPDSLEEVDLPLSFVYGVPDVVAVHLPQQSGSALVVLARPTVETAQLSRFVRPTPEGTVERVWEPLVLEDGVGVDRSPEDLSSAMRVRVAGYDGPPATPSRPWLDARMSDGLGALRESASALVASATGDSPRAVLSTIVADSLVDGSILDPVAVSADGADGRVVVVSTVTPAGAVLRSVLALDDGRSGSSTEVFESASLVPADQAEAPVLVRVSDSGPDTGRFLVVSPGGATAQLLSTSPNAYPVSKVTPFKGDTAVVTVINADDAAAFNLVVKDADGKETYRGVPPNGAWLFDLGDG